jgi:hypothetical protein
MHWLRTATRAGRTDIRSCEREHSRCNGGSWRPFQEPEKDWEIIADSLHQAGWSYGYVGTLDRKGRTIWIVDAHRDDGKRFIVHADERVTAFLELKSAIRLILRDLLDKTLSSLKISVHQDRAGLANGQFLSAGLMAFSELQSQS